MSKPYSVRPDASEYAPYYQSYIALVPEGDVVASLRSQLESAIGLLANVSEEKAGQSYAPGKWTVKELVGHIADTERVFAYRALCIARNDATPLPGFDQDQYASNANFNDRQMSDIAAEYEHVRRSTLALLQSLTDEAWLRTGSANGVEVSVRALAYIMAGHELHHMNILRTRYL